jgi:8-oxo-dGTP pyrophosphatase MutT (NUDIX family)
LSSELVRAAGGVIVRPGRGGQDEILVVHRPRYDDWTLPKGKCYPGESDKACAMREVQEETGLRCELGDEVAVVAYEDQAGRPKRVRYYAMSPLEDDEASPDNEVDGVRWLSRAEALRRLSYRRDAEIVKRALTA